MTSNMEDWMNPAIGLACLLGGQQHIEETLWWHSTNCMNGEKPCQQWTELHARHSWEQKQCLKDPPPLVLSSGRIVGSCVASKTVSTSNPKCAKRCGSHRASHLCSLLCWNQQTHHDPCNVLVDMGQQLLLLFSTCLTSWWPASIIFLLEPQSWHWWCATDNWGFKASPQQHQPKNAGHLSSWEEAGKLLSMPWCFAESRTLTIPEIFQLWTRQAQLQCCTVRWKDKISKKALQWDWLQNWPPKNILVLLCCCPKDKICLLWPFLSLKHKNIQPCMQENKHQQS